MGVWCLETGRVPETSMEKVGVIGVDTDMSSLVSVRFTYSLYSSQYNMSSFPLLVNFIVS